MTNSISTSSAAAAGAADDRRLLEQAPDRGEREPLWVADDLHLLRLVCQITDYEVADAPGDDRMAARSGERSGVPESRALPPEAPAP